MFQKCFKCYRHVYQSIKGHRLTKLTTLKTYINVSHQYLTTDCNPCITNLVWNSTPTYCFKGISQTMVYYRKSIWYNTIQYNTIQYNTIQNNITWLNP